MNESDYPPPTIREWVEGYWDLWSYVLGPRTKDQRDKCWRWDFLWDSSSVSVVVEWLLWRCPRLSPLFERYEVSRWEIIRCRRSGHPCGWIYYNPGGLEPDGHCKNCNEDLA